MFVVCDIKEYQKNSTRWYDALYHLFKCHVLKKSTQEGSTHATVWTCPWGEWQWPSRPRLMQLLRLKPIIGTGRGDELPYFKSAALRWTAVSARTLPWMKRGRNVVQSWPTKVRNLSINPLVLNSISTYVSNDMSLASFSSLEVSNS